MVYIEAILLGLIQGLTEFIPVSSSGHLLFIDEFLPTNFSYQFETLTNIGTLAAAIIYFRKDIQEAIQRRHTNNMLILLFIASAPVLLIGFTIGLLDPEILNSIGLSITMLTVVGITMIFSDKFNIREQKVSTKRQSLVIGLAQVLALIPGTSRSASTILGARMTGVNYTAAARFSFLLSIPVVGAAVAYTALFEQSSIEQSFGLIIVANIASFAAGLLAIHWLLKVLSRIGLKPFGYYRVLLGVMLLFLL